MKSPRTRLLPFLFICLLSLSPPAGFAAEFTVPDDPGCGTIQGCIDQAGDLDVIVVKPGTYVENIDFQGKVLKVRSQDGPDATVIDGGQADAVVTFASGEGQASLLEGFTITGAGPLGGAPGAARMGIRCVDASPVIRGNTITHQVEEEGAWLEAIHVEGLSAPLIRRNRLAENTVLAYATGAAYGVRVEQDAGAPTLEISSNEFLQNYAACQHPFGVCAGAAIEFSGESAVIVNNLLVTNGGTQANAGVTVQARRVEFLHNTVLWSVGNGGVFIEADTVASVLNNIVAYDMGTAQGPALCVIGAGSLTEDFNDL